MKRIWLFVRSILSTFVRFMRISYLEAKADYQNTRLGLLWMPLSTLVFSALLGLVFHSGGSHSPAQFFLYVLSGYITWSFISDSISSSVSLIQSRLDFAVHNNMGVAGLFGKVLADRVFEYGINVGLLIIATALLAPAGFGLHSLLFVPFVAMLAATSLAVSYLVNLLTLLFADLGNIIKTGVRLMFFATPVFWAAGERSSGDIRVILETYNPAAYYLQMSREVFGIEPLSWHVWLISAAITLMVTALGAVLYSRTYNFVRNVK